MWAFDRVEGPSIWLQLVLVVAFRLLLRLGSRFSGSWMLRAQTWSRWLLYARLLGDLDEFGGFGMQFVGLRYWPIWQYRRRMSRSYCRFWWVCPLWISGITEDPVRFLVGLLNVLGSLRRLPYWILFGSSDLWDRTVAGIFLSQNSGRFNFYINNYSISSLLSVPVSQIRGIVTKFFKTYKQFNRILNWQYVLCTCYATPHKAWYKTNIQ